MPTIHAIFTRHRLKGTTQNVGLYSEEMVRELYASYLATLRSKFDRRSNPAKQAPLEYVQSAASGLTFLCRPFAGFSMARTLMPPGPPYY